MKKCHHMTIDQLKQIHKEVMKVSKLVIGADFWIPFEQWLIRAVQEGV